MTNPQTHWSQPRARPEWSAAKLEGAHELATKIDTAALMVVHRGEPVCQWGDVTARYKCHSIRKSLLSALIGIHVDEGRIVLDRTLADLGIDDREGLSERERAATVLDLLTAARASIIRRTTRPRA